MEMESREPGRAIVTFRLLRSRFADAWRRILGWFPFPVRAALRVDVASMVRQSGVSVPPPHMAPGIAAPTGD